MMMYNSMGLAGWLIMLAFAALVIAPFWMLMPKFNLPKPLALIAIFPPGALLLIWVMALRDVSPTKERI